MSPQIIGPLCALRLAPSVNKALTKPIRAAVGAISPELLQIMNDIIELITKGLDIKCGLPPLGKNDAVNPKALLDILKRPKTINAFMQFLLKLGVPDPNEAKKLAEGKAGEAAAKVSEKKKEMEEKLLSFLDSVIRIFVEEDKLKQIIGEINRVNKELLEKYPDIKKFDDQNPKEGIIQILKTFSNPELRRLPEQVIEKAQSNISTKLQKFNDPGFIAKLSGKIQKNPEETIQILENRPYSLTFPPDIKAKLMAVQNKVGEAKKQAEEAQNKVKEAQQLAEAEAPAVPAPAVPAPAVPAPAALPLRPPNGGRKKRKRKTRRKFKRKSKKKTSKKKRKRKSKKKTKKRKYKKRY